MTPDILTALLAFAFVTSITPGPNNLMLMASGANFGIRRTIPHMLGVGIGFVIMVVLVGAGLSGIFEAYPVSYTILRAVSVVYLLYLAWRIATAAPAAGASATGARPFTFVEAALFQWVNPKAWAMALTAVSVYAPDRGILSVLLVAAVFGVVNLPCVGSWTFVGERMNRVLSTPARLRAFNAAMGVLLVASLYPTLFPAV